MVFRSLFQALLLLCATILSAKSQVVVSEPAELAELAVPGYKLLYGHRYLEDIYLVADNEKLIMLKQPDGVEFQLLRDDNTSRSSLFIKSAPANIRISSNNGIYNYQSLFMYKGNLCVCCDYTAGEVFFMIENQKLKFISCSQMDSRYVNNMHFEKVGALKLTTLEKEKDKKKTNYIQSGFAINDQFIIKRQVITPKTEYASLFPYIATKNGILVADLLGNKLLTIGPDSKVADKKITFNYPFPDSASTFDKTQLVYDQARDKTYIIVYRKSITKAETTDRQLFFELKDDKFINLSGYLPQMAKRIQINNGRIFALFNKRDDHKGSTLLYESINILPN